MAKKSDAATELDDALKQQRVKAKVAAAVKAIQAAYDLGRASLEEHGEDLYRRRKTKIPKFVVPKFAAPKKDMRGDFVERGPAICCSFQSDDGRSAGPLVQEASLPAGGDIDIFGFAPG